MNAKVLRFGAVGAGFWARFQLAAWKELQGVECVALCDRFSEKAESLAHHLSIQRVYSDVDLLLRQEQLDFVDVITEVDSHAPLVRKAASYGLPVICQKPMASSLNVAKQMVRNCSEAAVPLFIHENWRWQTPIRRLKELLVLGKVGTPIRARVQFVTGFDFLKNQPGLASVEQLLLADLGVHILDTTRFLFGEADSLYCQTQRVHRGIRGEDMGTLVLKTTAGMTVICQLAYSGIPVEHDHFPQTFVFVEGERGSVELCADYWIRLTTEEGTLARRYPPPRYAWADPAYEVVHASMVLCNESFLRELQGQGTAETTGEDQLRTARLVFAAYESAARGEVVRLPTSSGVCS
ncbi:MAG: Gfo/Idh/MocA family oxidoreductase [Acidobacteriota bacterium]